jgi:hypothetical protein
MKKTHKAMAALTIPVAAVMSTLVLTPAATAAPAAGCSSPSWSDKDGGSGEPNKYNAAVHSGPEGVCAILFDVDPGTTLQYDCYVVNSSGNTWTHIKGPGANSVGWIWDAYLNDNGATSRC